MSNTTQAKPERLIDARGPRYTAAITTVVLSAVLFGLRRSLYGFIYRNLVQPRLSGPVPSENEAAPRFAQLVGALFAATALLGGLTGNTAVFLIATSFALGAAFLNAAFGFCLGCQFYLILLRAKSRITSRN